MAGALAFLPVAGTIVASLIAGPSAAGTITATIGGILSGQGPTSVSGILTNPAFDQSPQVYSTVPFANLKLALYRLVIVGPNNKSLGGSDYEYIFPLSPASISKSYTSLTSYYDVRGPSNTYGVTRIVDQYGQTPPMITISGTTGFQFHNLDGFKWSGLGSLLKLIKLFKDYAGFQQDIVDNPPTGTLGIGPVTMQFFDGYTNESWEVVPYGVQAIKMDQSRPIIQTYDLQLLAVKYLNQPEPPQPDFVDELIIQARGDLAQGFRGYWNSVIVNISSAQNF